MKKTICPFCGKPGIQRYFELAGCALGEFETTEVDPTTGKWVPLGEPYYCPHCDRNIWDRNLKVSPGRRGLKK